MLWFDLAHLVLFENLTKCRPLGIDKALQILNVFIASANDLASISVMSAELQLLIYESLVSLKFLQLSGWRSQAVTVADIGGYSENFLLRMRCNRQYDTPEIT